MSCQVQFILKSQQKIQKEPEDFTHLFDWKIEKAPGPFEYWNLSTSYESGNNEIGGGLKRQDPQQKINNYIGVSSINEYSSKTEKLGSKVLVPNMAVPGHGYMAVYVDTEDNTFCLWPQALS